MRRLRPTAGTNQGQIRRLATYTVCSCLVALAWARYRRCGSKRKPADRRLICSRCGYSAQAKTTAQAGEGRSWPTSRRPASRTRDRLPFDSTTIVAEPCESHVARRADIRRNPRNGRILQTKASRRHRRSVNGIKFGRRKTKAWRRLWPLLVRQ